MNAYTLTAITIVCMTVLILALIWAAVRTNDRKAK